MTIDLIRRLYHGGVIPAHALEAALHRSISQRIPFLQALTSQVSLASDLVDRELERITGPGLDFGGADPDLVVKLPTGLCDALLAVPVGRDPTTNEVIVATADPLDPHVAEEISYHLDLPVVALQAARKRILHALEASRASQTLPSEQHPGEVEPDLPLPVGDLVTSWSRPAEDPNPSDPHDTPIPLVRRSIAPRSKAPTPPELTEASVSRPGARVTGSDLRQATLDLDNPSIEPALEALELASRPDEVVEELVKALSPFARQVVIFAEHGGMHSGRAASTSLGGAQAARLVEQPGSPDCVLDQAIAAGRYLGRLAPVASNAAIGSLLGSQSGEIYAVPVVVLGRPALVLLLASLAATALATRRADDLARAAAASLERILIARKSRA